MLRIPQEISGRGYVSLTTFRRDGTPVPTPLWFAESGDKLYIMTRGDSWKYKRIRNNPEVRVAPCTARGRVTGPEFAGTARLLPESEWAGTRQLLARKYWLMRLPFLWNKKNVFLEIAVT
jgi:PPOX class probable F420-dependent enzyme